MREVDKMLGILHHYAPTGVEQQEYSALVRGMQMEGLPDDDVVVKLAEVLITGIRTGDWTLAEDERLTASSGGYTRAGS